MLSILGGYYPPTKIISHHEADIQTVRLVGLNSVGQSA